MKSKRDHAAKRLAKEILEGKKFLESDIFKLTCLSNYICHLRYLIDHGNKDSYLVHKWMYSLIQYENEYKALYDKVYKTKKVTRLPTKNLKDIRGSI